MSYTEESRLSKLYDPEHEDERSSLCGGASNSMSTGFEEGIACTVASHLSW